MKTNIEPDALCLIVGGDFFGESVTALRPMPAGTRNIFAPGCMGSIYVRFNCWGVEHTSGECSAIREDFLRRLDGYESEHQERREELVHD